MYNCNTDSLGLILGVEVFFSGGHCSGALCNNNFHHLGRPQMCAGAWYVFGTWKPHSETLWQVKRFKWGFSQVLMNTTIFDFEFPSTGICFWFWTWFSCRPMTMKQGLSQPITASRHHCGRGGAVNYTQINQHNKRREIWIRTFTSSSGLQEILIWSGCLRNSKTQDLCYESKYFFCIPETPRLPEIQTCLSKVTLYCRVSISPDWCPGSSL